jgi:hypothetical protein
MPPWIGVVGLPGSAKLRLPLRMDDGGQGVLRIAEDSSPLEASMSDLSGTLLKGSIDEGFKNQTGEERLAFVERLFSEPPTGSRNVSYGPWSEIWSLPSRDRMPTSLGCMTTLSAVSRRGRLWELKGDRVSVLAPRPLADAARERCGFAPDGTVTGRLERR